MPLCDFPSSGYADKSHPPKGYTRQEHKTTRRACKPYSHLRPAPPVEALQDVLSGPDVDGLALMLASVPHGREAKLLEGHAFVERVKRVLCGSSSAAADVEAHLDLVFADLQAGREFAHTEVVMALLFAMKQAEVSSLAEILSVLGKSRAPEIAKLRRFALSLI